MGEEIPNKPSQIGKLHEAPEALRAPRYPHNCWKVFNYLESLLVGCKQILRALLLKLALRRRLRGREWRRGVVLVEHRETIGRLSCWVGWRGVLRIGDTALILGLFLLHEKLVFTLDRRLACRQLGLLTPDHLSLLGQQL